MTLYHLFLLIAVFCYASSIPAREEYKYMPYNEMETYFFALAEKYPKLIRIENAQDKYGLPYQQCPTECPIYIITLTEFDTLTPERPQIFLSGAVHGDEVIGPNVLAYLASYMLRGYNLDKWLTYLLQNRVTVLMPAANAIGYYLEYREEIVNRTSYDPNRDFPYNNPAGTCMNTLTARSILKVFKDHAFILGITFHGGDNAIGYQWGSENHEEKGKAEECPDDVAMAQLGKILKSEASEVKAHKIDPYILGRITDVVYSATGGLEDWAYAASWANIIEKNSMNTSCNTSTYGGFNNSELEVGNTSVRFPLYLVETGFDKHPSDSLFGNEDGIKGKNTSDDGHIPRNIRLCLTLIDFAQPYVRDIKTIDYNSTHTMITWKLGGSVYVNETYVEWDENKKSYAESVENVENRRADHRTSMAISKRIYRYSTQKQKGGSVWISPNPEFTAFVPWSKEDETEYVFRVAAVTDLQWGLQIDPKPKVKELTHFARLRTNLKYIASQNDTLIYSPSQIVYSPSIITRYQEKGGAPWGLLIGVLIGAPIVAIVATVFAICCYCKKNRNNAQKYYQSRQADLTVNS